MIGAKKVGGKPAQPAPQQTSSRRSTTDSMKTEEDDSPPKIVKSEAASPEHPKNEVIGDHCLVCNDRCFIRSVAEKLTPAERKLSGELREMFYEIYQIPLESDFIKAKAVRHEFPLCYSCSFHLGQLKHLHDKLKELHRDFIKLQETVAFSIVDVVAGSVPQRPLLDFSTLSQETLILFMKRSERTTLQNIIYNGKCYIILFMLSSFQRCYLYIQLFYIFGFSFFRMARQSPIIPGLHKWHSSNYYPDRGCTSSFKGHGTSRCVQRCSQGRSNPSHEANSQ